MGRIPYRYLLPHHVYLHTVKEPEMQKYAEDLSTNDVILINGEEVMLDFLSPMPNDKIHVRGYFYSNGDDFSQIVNADFIFRVVSHG